MDQWEKVSRLLPRTPSPRSDFKTPHSNFHCRILAHHLTREERSLVIRTVRNTLDTNQLSHIPLIAGTGGNSTRETILLTNDAAKEGATHAMVIAPGYFAGALGKKGLKQFFCDVARESKIPVSLAALST